MALVAVAFFAVRSFAFDNAIKRIESDTSADLAFTAQALEKDLARYKLLAKSLSQTDAIRRRALSDHPTYDAVAENLFLRMAAISGAGHIQFLTRATAPAGPVRGAVLGAYQGVMGLAFDPAENGTFLIAAPVWIGNRVAGTVTIDIAAADFEWSWRALPQTVFFVGPEGTIRLSSQSALRLRSVDAAGIAITDQAPQSDRSPFWYGRDHADQLPGVIYDQALVVRRPVPSIDMTAYALIDTRPAHAAARLAGTTAGAIALIIAMIAAGMTQWRISEQARHAQEARATAELERRVADRTSALTAEIAERRATEDRLRTTQDELVQAGKLSALGQMAAAIAHEINQPLAAIRGFAENATVFLDRGRVQDARGNLDEIASLTGRAARIIRNLRAFARNQTEEVTATNLPEVVDDALEIIAVRARREEADIRWQRPKKAAVVMAGSVRLQQVLINLIANALDAQSGEDPAIVDITVHVDGSAGEYLCLAVRDHGGGLADDVCARMFDPFFSTKSVSGEGMGLGLSISHGIITGFGGTLTANNHPEGGAVFTVRLRRAETATLAA
ncbi:MAG: ATP-binding protein [Pseudomonadota bacterium]